MGVQSSYAQLPVIDSRSKVIEAVCTNSNVMHPCVGDEVKSGGGVL